MSDLEENWYWGDGDGRESDDEGVSVEPLTLEQIEDMLYPNLPTDRTERDAMIKARSDRLAARQDAIAIQKALAEKEFERIWQARRAGME